MKLSENHILIISPETWNGHFVSKHHYAVTLAASGHNVYFLNPPDNTLSEVSVKSTKYQNLWEVSSPQVAKGLRFYPKKLRNYLEKKWLMKLEKSIGHKFSTVWLFENSRFYDMAFAGDRTKIYHQVDSNQNFHVSKASRSADICFCVTDFIKKDLLKYCENTYKISHGIDLKQEEQKLSKEQLKWLRQEGIHVAYVGNLDMIYINEDIICKLVKNNAKVFFHFIGNYSENAKLYQLCKDEKNIIWWGQVKSSMILEILEKVDVNLLVYRVEQYKEQLANSHKLLEYLYSGKVTVATYTDEYKDKRNLLVMVDDTKAFLDVFEKVIDDLSYYNSPQKQSERTEFAENHTYSKQLDTIISYLEQHNLHL